MDLLETIALRNQELQERGRTAFALPAEAEQALLAFLWGQSVEPVVLRRAVEAAVALETKLAWRTLAMPLVPPGGDPFARSRFERLNDWKEAKPG